MKTNKAALLAVIASTVLAAGAYAEDQRKGPGHRYGGDGMGMPAQGMRLERMAEHLDLNETQQEQIKNILEAARPEFEALREKQQANREALKNLDANDPQVQNIATSNGELATEKTLLRSRVRAEINAVLTDEQRKTFAEHQEKRQERRQRRQRQR